MPQINVKHDFVFQLLIRGDYKQKITFPVLSHLLIRFILVQLLFKGMDPFIRREAQYVPHPPFASTQP